jgi:hypothetical protein
MEVGIERNDNAATLGCSLNNRFVRRIRQSHFRYVDDVPS